jgi:hypothetical protein
LKGRGGATASKDLWWGSKIRPRYRRRTFAVWVRRSQEDGTAPAHEPHHAARDHMFFGASRQVYVWGQNCNEPHHSAHDHMFFGSCRRSGRKQKQPAMRGAIPPPRRS